MFVGIDVSHGRGCTIAALDSNGRLVSLEWTEKVSGATIDEHASRAADSVRKLVAPSAAPHIGIDAPRVLLSSPREWYWDRGRWRRRQPGEQGLGRHCEVVIKAMKLANPQWTPLASDVSASHWMALGVALFQHLAALGPVYEVFPSASYKVLKDSDEPRVDLSFRGFIRGPKDAVDAVMAAVTVREFVEGRGWETPAGDGLGSIVLPRRPLTKIDPAVERWPRSHRAV